MFFWIVTRVLSFFRFSLPFSRLAHSTMPFSDCFPLIFVYSFVSFTNTVPPSFSFTPKAIIVTISPFFPWVLFQFRVTSRLLSPFGNAWQQRLLFPPWSFSIVFLSVSFVIAHFLFLCIWIFLCWSVVPSLSSYAPPIIFVSHNPYVFWWYLLRVLSDFSSVLSLGSTT